MYFLSTFITIEIMYGHFAIMYTTYILRHVCRLCHIFQTWSWRRSRGSLALPSSCYL